MFAIRAGDITLASKNFVGELVEFILSEIIIADINELVDKILNRTPPEISNTEQALPHYTRKLLAQLRTNK